jgi:hypothetical protein
MTRRVPEARHEASLVGGDERSLGLKRTPAVRAVATTPQPATADRNTR